MAKKRIKRKERKSKSSIQELAERIGELFLEERFITNCKSPSNLFSAARLERFTRREFPRILLDPAVIASSRLDIKRLASDLRYLSNLVSKNPQGFKELTRHLNDPNRFTKLAKRLGLSEQKFIAAGGGWLLFLIVIATAVVLSGCGSGAAPCGAQHPQNSALTCDKPAGHTGKHKNDRFGLEW